MEGHIDARSRRRRIWQISGVTAFVIVLLFGFYLLWARRSALPDIAALPPGEIPALLVERGRQLATIGDCQGCHTVTPAAPFAGGASVKTPLGTLYGPNITPDPATGIGHWSLPAFARALREGVGRDGRHLYPALPYEHFASLTDDDIAALYAYVMTQQPVHATAPDHRLYPPFGFRPLLAAWKLLFARPGAFMPPAGPDPLWNRGAYLTEALGHCGACHRPRNLMQAERPDRGLSGGKGDGWNTPPLDGSGKKWTAVQVEAYLTTGRAPDGSMARGPMAKVVKSLSQAPRAEKHAIAVYIASRMAGKEPGKHG